jgi:pyridoxine 4-dehydrogenase
VSFEDIPLGDYRRVFPRYQPGNLAVNRKLVEDIEKLAEKNGCTIAQVSLGWLLALSNREGMPKIIPIPGSGTYSSI